MRGFHGIHAAPGSAGCINPSQAAQSGCNTPVFGHKSAPVRIAYLFLESLSRKGNIDGSKFKVMLADEIKEKADSETGNNFYGWSGWFQDVSVFSMRFIWRILFSRGKTTLIRIIILARWFFIKFDLPSTQTLNPWNGRPESRAMTDLVRRSRTKHTESHGGATEQIGGATETNCGATEQTLRMCSQKCLPIFELSVHPSGTILNFSALTFESSLPI